MRDEYHTFYNSALSHEKFHILFSAQLSPPM
nr:MAG TPA: hypothetical protein [Caudoviricetes sp.]